MFSVKIENLFKKPTQRYAQLVDFYTYVKCFSLIFVLHIKLASLQEPLACNAIFGLFKKINDETNFSKHIN